MMKRCAKWVIVFLVLSLATVGCSIPEKGDQDTIAYIKKQQKSMYADTFKELSLGQIFDFELKLPHADTSWARIWVEGYSKGKPIPSSSLSSLSYGLSPSETSEGPMGFAIMNGDNNRQFLKIYAPGASTGMSEMKDAIQKDMSAMWGYAIGDGEMIQLKPGETRILAMYRQREEAAFRTLDPNDEQQLKEMIDMDDTLLLMKIKVDKQEHLK